MKIVFSICLAAIMLTAQAAQTTDKLTEAQLKQAYWICDYESATTGLLSAGDAGACSAVYEQLLVTFAPNGTNAERYTAFMKWWQANKDKEHAKLKATS